MTRLFGSPHIAVVSRGILFPAYQKKRNALLSFFGKFTRKNADNCCEFVHSKFLHELDQWHNVMQSCNVRSSG